MKTAILAFLYCGVFDSVLTTTNDGDPCEYVRVTGTVRHHAAGGQYELVPTSRRMCQGRRVYEQRGGHFYMYYRDSGDSWTGWLVGGSLCGSSGILRRPGQSEYPYEPWYPYEGGTKVAWEEESEEFSWEPNSGLDVICEPGFSGCEAVYLPHSVRDPHLEGAYDRIHYDMCNGRPVYRLRDLESYYGTYYLYHDDHYWVVGDSICDNVINLRKYYSEQVPVFQLIVN